MKQELEIGQTATGIYKTGKYIGEITNIRSSHITIRVLAVVTHPQQGDLHNPKQVDVTFFHERRALAFGEQVNLPRSHCKPFSGEVPKYKQSLQAALEKEYTALENDNSEWARKSVQILTSLQEDYFK